MEKELKHELMEINMLVNLLMIKCMDIESLNIQMEIFMWVNIKIIKNTVKESSLGHIIIYMMENGRMIIRKDMAFLNFQMDIDMNENFQEIRNIEIALIMLLKVMFL
jgi:hypothetical protein